MIKARFAPLANRIASTPGTNGAAKKQPRQDYSFPQRVAHHKAGKRSLIQQNQ
jgi:hypothetical protein